MKIKKKTYNPPRLVFYGRVKDITLGGSGVTVENSGLPPQAQPNRRP